MKTKEDIVTNWLPRYTDTPLEGFGKHILLTNFISYVDEFARAEKAEVRGLLKPMQTATSTDGITIVNFGMGCTESICHAYENFVRHCIALAKGKPDYGGRRVETMIRDATRLFGKRIADDCLAARQVRVARLVRNALAHSGGRETRQLRAFCHDLAIEGGVVQILASDTRNLFELLKRRATLKLVKKAVTLPEMRQLPAD